MGRFVDLTGQKFNRLTVIDRVNNSPSGRVRWYCECDCGGTAICHSMSLVSEKTGSCGCIQRIRTSEAKVKNLIGIKFGRLTVIESKGSDVNSKALWLCRCDCGRNIVARSGDLSSGNTRSCGCIQKEITSARLKLQSGVASFNMLFSRYKRGAEERGHDFSLTEEQFKELTKSNCNYCGIKPFSESRNSGKDTNGSYVYNGVDRVDNTKGYTITNCVPCCKHCNLAKRDRSYFEFVSWVKLVSNHLNLNQVP